LVASRRSMVSTHCCSSALLNRAGTQTTTWPFSRKAVTVRRRRAERRTSTTGSSMREPYRATWSKTCHPHPVESVDAGQHVHRHMRTHVFNSLAHRCSTVVHGVSHRSSTEFSTGRGRNSADCVDRLPVHLYGHPRTGPSSPAGRTHGEGVQAATTGLGEPAAMPAVRSSRYPAAETTARPAVRQRHGSNAGARSRPASTMIDEP
jgi:hypothetical protein